MFYLETLKANLIAKGYEVSCFDTAADAASYLDAQIDQKSVGFGGSMTLKQMGLYERLRTHNTVYWHWEPGELSDAQCRQQANAAQIYLSSVNGLAMSGEIINIDGNCNRVAAVFYGHEKVYLVAGINKIAEDEAQALYRARNIAAPRNAQRLGSKTPCAAKGDRCYDCSSPQRICRGLSVLWEAPMSGRYEVILIREDLLDIERSMAIEQKAERNTADLSFVHQYGNDVTELIDAPADSSALNLGCGNGL